MFFFVLPLLPQRWRELFNDHQVSLAGVAFKSHKMCSYIEPTTPADDMATRAEHRA